MSITKAISILDKSIPNPTEGLNKEIFEFISRTTPLVNVDLLIKDELNRTLLAWRDDEYCGRGWHVVGGIVRFKETLEHRIEKVAELEIETKIVYNPIPISVNQLISQNYTIRAHFISFLYSCKLPSNFIPLNKDKFPTTPGFLQWHNYCPDNLVKPQDVYRRYI